MNTKKYTFFIFVVFLTTTLFSQEDYYAGDAEVIGGKEYVEQILQTQLSLPKALLTKNLDKEIKVTFEIDSFGNARKLGFEKGLNNVLRYEVSRMFHFLRFRRSTELTYMHDIYQYTFHVSTENYNKYAKQKSKGFIKGGQMADSSYTIYQKADKSPEYYKNSDEGLVSFIQSEIEYPSVAKERSIEGTVVIEFVVETNGFVTNLVVKQGVNGGCSEEALRVIKQTKWQPAVLNGKLVRYKLTYPITFSLQNIFKDNSSSRQTLGGQ